MHEFVALHKHGACSDVNQHDMLQRVSPRYAGPANVSPGLLESKSQRTHQESKAIRLSDSFPCFVITNTENKCFAIHAEMRLENNPKINRRA
jgi:hypothetical protein